MASDLLLAVAVGAGLALASSAHCMVMCGPLAAATHSRGGGSATYQYMTGRVAGYTLLGVLAGSLGNVLVSSPWARWGEASLSWLLAVSLAFAGVAQLRLSRKEPVIKLGRAPRRSRTGRVLARVADEPLLLGIATALLPCGALFTAIGAAAALGDPLSGALAMATFAVGSALALAIVGQVARVGALGPLGRRALASVLLVGAAVMLIRPIPSLRAEGEATCHSPSGAR